MPRRHGRALAAAGIDGLYAATDPDGRVIALLRDDGRAHQVGGGAAARDLVVHESCGNAVACPHSL